MSYKQMPRLGSAIASTILSLFSAVSLVGVDKAQAAVFTFNFDGDDASGVFKVDNSSVTGREVEEIAVSEGRLYTWLTNGFNRYKRQPIEYFDLAGATAYFYQGNFRGLRASGFDELTPEDNTIVDEGVTYYTNNTGHVIWSLDTYGVTDEMWASVFQGYYEVLLGLDAVDRRVIWNGTAVSYTLVKTETVPEPLTVGGTALALAGLSWLKHKKKMAA
jgi:hypothetical protein